MKNINERVNNIKLTEVIVSKVTKGTGTEKDPIRGVYQFWSKKGNFIAEKDVNDFVMEIF